MITNIKIWEEFEKNLLRNSKPDYQKNLKIFQQLYEESKLLKVFPPKNPLEGFESEINIAKVLKKIK